MKDASWTRLGKKTFIVSAAMVALDQMTKYWVVVSLPKGGGKELIPGLFSVVYWENTGAAWGMLSGKTLLLAVVSVIALVMMVIYYRQFVGAYAERGVAASLILGGIAGNLIDRLFRPGVVDFISCYIQTDAKTWQWPAFNVADSAICVGVAIYLISTFLRPEESEKAQTKDKVAPLKSTDKS